MCPFISIDIVDHVISFLIEIGNLILIVCEFVIYGLKNHVLFSDAAEVFNAVDYHLLNF